MCIAHLYVYDSLSTSCNAFKTLHNTNIKADFYYKKSQFQ